MIHIFELTSAAGILQNGTTDNMEYMRIIVDEPTVRVEILKDDFHWFNPKTDIEFEMSNEDAISLSKAILSALNAG